MKKAILLALLLNGILLFIANAEPKDTPFQSQPNMAIKDLGIKPIDFGSKDQAIELLLLIKREPNKKAYAIFFATEEGAVGFCYMVSADTLERFHKFRDGRGKKEKWIFYAKERLKSVAAGDSLDDTPIGKSPGILEEY